VAAFCNPLSDLWSDRLGLAIAWTYPTIVLREQLLRVIQPSNIKFFIKFGTSHLFPRPVPGLSFLCRGMKRRRISFGCRSDSIGI